MDIGESSRGYDDIGLDEWRSSGFIGSAPSPPGGCTITDFPLPLLPISEAPTPFSSCKVIYVLTGRHTHFVLHRGPTESASATSSQSPRPRCSWRRPTLDGRFGIAPVRGPCYDKACPSPFPSADRLGRPCGLARFAVSALLNQACIVLCAGGAWVGGSPSCA